MKSVDLTNQKQLDGIVEIRKESSNFILYRNNKPYYIKGIGGMNNLELAKSYGANSFRTWTSKHAKKVLDTALQYEMTVMLGISMSKKEEHYMDDSYKTKKRQEVQELLNTNKSNPSLLVWAIGNEINLGTNCVEAWKFVGELATLIKEQDPNHPVCTVLAGANPDVINNIVKYAPDIEVIGINSYAGALKKLKTNCDKNQFEGPYIITEWGPTGHWEIDKTNWNVPIEQTSSEKVKSYIEGYEYINSHNDLFLGSYVFLWGQKEERTPTWYGMFVETNDDLELSGESCPTVDAMCYSWTGKWPTSQAPNLTSLTLNNKQAAESVIVTKSETCLAQVLATHPDGDQLVYTWEILKEATKLGVGGSYEPRPLQITKKVKTVNNQYQFSIDSAGMYRLYVYVLDGNKHVATANIPFKVE